MSRSYKFRDQERLYFVSFATINWIDVFIRRVYKDIIVNSLNHCIDKKGLELYAWCIMTSHVHLIMGTEGEQMEFILRDMKKFTSKALREEITENPQESRREWMIWMMERAGKYNPNNNDFQFWQQNNNPIELYDNEIMEQKLEYIHNNPVEAGFVDEPWEYLYSSARDYCGKKGLIRVKLIE